MKAMLHSLVEVPRALVHCRGRDLPLASVMDGGGGDDGDIGVIVVVIVVVVVLVMMM